MITKRNKEKQPYVVPRTELVTVGNERHIFASSQRLKEISIKDSEKEKGNHHGVDSKGRVEDQS
jgi:hypothetical protein